MTNKHWHKYLIFVLFCTAIYFPLFLHLDWQPMNNWDESLFAMRSAYMTEEGKYIRDYSLWLEGSGMVHRSTKPPFTTWLQVASMKLFGINELALRLPIAFFSLGIVFLFVWFSRKTLGSIHIGYCAGFVLVTSIGFVREHGSRTGDQDAALAFYMLAGAMAFYQYLAANEDRKRLGWLAILTASSIAAVMTKYAFGLLFFPAFLLYAIYKKQFWNIVKRGSTWLAMLLVILPLVGWLWYIEGQLPGFVKQAFFHEMADRYVSTIDGHKHAFNFYFVRFWEKDFFMPWLLLLPAPLSLFFIKQQSPLRDFTLLMLLCAVTQLVFVSSSGTITDHYDVITYAPMAMLAGIGLYLVWKEIMANWKEGTHRTAIFLVAFWMGIFFLILPYYTIFFKIYKPVIEDRTMAYGYLFRKIQKDRPEYKQFTVLAPVYTGQVNYYAGLLNRKKGYNISISEHPKLVEVGDTIFVCESKMIEALMENYELKAIESEGKCFLAIAMAKKMKPTEAVIGH